MHYATLALHDERIFGAQGEAMDFISVLELDATAGIAVSNLGRGVDDGLHKFLVPLVLDPSFQGRAVVDAQPFDAVTHHATCGSDLALLGVTLEGEDVGDGRQFGLPLHGRNDGLSDLDLVGVVDSLLLQGIEDPKLSPTGVAQMNQPACGFSSDWAIDLRCFEKSGKRAGIVVEGQGFDRKKTSLQGKSFLFGAIQQIVDGCKRANAPGDAGESC